jgi:RecA-family ATPase
VILGALTVTVSRRVNASMSEPLDFLPHDYILAHPRSPRPIALEGVLRVGDLVIITGTYDAFKSVLSMELAWSLATGRAWLGHNVIRRVRMGLLQVEIDPGSHDERCRAFPPAADLSICSCIGFTFDRLLELKTVTDDMELEGLVIDPLGQVWPGVARNGETFSENHKNHVSPLMTELKEFRKTIILVHHDPKATANFQGRASGSAAILNDPDVRIFVDRTAGTNDIHISFKNRLQKPAKSLTARFNEDTMRLEVISRDRPRSRADRAVKEGTHG